MNPEPAVDPIFSVVLVSEGRRAILSAWVFALLAALLLIVVYVPGAWPPSQAAAMRQLLWPMLLLFGGMVLYELRLRFRIRHLLGIRRLPGWVFRYANALVEISVPSVIIIMLAEVITPLQALASPAPFLYPLMISMTVLYLDKWVCVFGGAVAALQFGALVMFYLSAQRDYSGIDLLSDPRAYFVKGALLFTLGLVAGYLTQELKRQMRVAVHNAEQRDHAISVFGQHVSPVIAEKLLKQHVEITAEERDACVMFLDIRDFSRIAADKVPAEVMDYLNRIFGVFIDVVNVHRGIVNKFLGDGFMAVFGAPIDDDEKCQHAVDAAMEIHQRLEELNRSGLIPPTRIGIGLHAGRLMTGNVGTSRRKEYTLIGETVNLASRIEMVTKDYNAPVLVSREVWDCLKQKPAGAENLGMVELRGQSRPIHLYKLTPAAQVSGG
ncbi:MAG: adenylate/guanylate cyclase domain-containing protein [Thiobacillaceae bacterium]